ncbi:Cytochrome b [Atta colombica]|uniref:Cytochrome b n=1 Tax=Atta colombica TaxID=520822 RepID=A0A151I355_9HYME|nr:Cytochrome b [Atta colombica]
MFHLFFLHLYKIPFHPYFTFKDLLGFNVILSIFLFIILQHHYIFRDPDNFTPANPLVTPTIFNILPFCLCYFSVYPNK